MYNDIDDEYRVLEPKVYKHGRGESWLNLNSFFWRIVAKSRGMAMACGIAIQTKVRCL